MDKGAENYQRSKSRTRTVPVLNDSQRKRFITMCARGASGGEFEIKFGLGARDVTRLRKEYDIVTDDEARRLEKSFALEELALDRVKQEEAAVARQEAILANERLRQRELADSQPKEKAEININVLKAEHKKRQKRLDDSLEKANIPSGESLWHLPQDVSRDNFYVWLTNYGLRFVRDRFGIGDSDIRREVGRLGLKVNWDLVRR